MLTNDVLRNGVAADVVLANAQADAASAGAGAALQQPRPSVYTDTRIQPLVSNPFKRLAKRLARPLVPVLRPIAGRLRTYLLYPAMQQLGASLDAQSVQLAAIRNSVAQIQQSTALLRQAMAEIRQDMGRMQRVEEYAMAAARRIAVPGRDGEVLVRTAVGYVLCPSNDPALLAILLEAGELETGTRLLIERLLRPGDVFIDVGANVGMHTLAAARAVQAQGRVVAFEPFDQTAALLARTVWLNGFQGFVDVRQSAVSDRSGTQQLHIGRTSGHNSLFQLPASDSAGGATAQVPLVTLDDALPRGSRIDVLKIDVEGAELDVLRGSTRALADNPDAGLIVEYGFSHLQRTGQTTAGWLSAFRSLGLEHRMVDASTGAVLAVTDDQLEQAGATNLLLARPQSPIWQRAEGRA